MPETERNIHTRAFIRVSEPVLDTDLGSGRTLRWCSPPSPPSSWPPSACRLLSRSLQQGSSTNYQEISQLMQLQANAKVFLLQSVCKSTYLIPDCLVKTFLMFHYVQVQCTPIKLRDYRNKDKMSS